MSSKKLMTSISAVAVLSLLSQTAWESNADNALATTNAIAISARSDDTAPSPDFNGDGTFVFSDLIAFASQFGKTVSRPQATPSSPRPRSPRYRRPSVASALLGLEP